eukprot:1160914-Pelagomonas_calceolata.AAC.9
MRSLIRYQALQRRGTGFLRVPWRAAMDSKVAAGAQIQVQRQESQLPMQLISCSWSTDPGAATGKPATHAANQLQLEHRSRCSNREASYPCSQLAAAGAQIQVQQQESQLPKQSLEGAPASRHSQILGVPRASDCPTDSFKVAT